MSAQQNSPRQQQRPQKNRSRLDPEAEAKLNHDLKRMALILGWMVISAGALWALIRLFPLVRWGLSALSPFLIALVIAYLFNPIVNVVQKRFKLGRVGGIVAVAIIISCLFLAFAGLLLPILYVQTFNIVTALKANGPELIDSAAQAADNVFQKWTGQQPGKLAEKVKELIQNVDLDALAERLTSAAPGITQGGLKVLGGTAGVIRNLFTGVSVFFATAILAVVIAFYYLLEFDAIPKAMRLAIPDSIEDRAMEVLGKVDVAVGGFLRGQLIVCSLVGLLATIGLTMIGMYKYALIVGVLAGAANFIPYLGPAMGAAPALLWALLSSSNPTWSDRFVSVGLVIGLFALIQAIDGFVFQPRIIGKSSNLHPLAVMAALVVGGQFGVGGMILAVPLACVVRVLLLEFWWTPHVVERKPKRPPPRKQQRRRRPPKPPEHSGSSGSSTLRIDPDYKGKNL